VPTGGHEDCPLAAARSAHFVRRSWCDSRWVVTAWITPRNLHARRTAVYRFRACGAAGTAAGLLPRALNAARAISWRGSSRPALWLSALAAGLATFVGTSAIGPRSRPSLLVSIGGTGVWRLICEEPYNAAYNHPHLTETTPENMGPINRGWWCSWRESPR